MCEPVSCTQRGSLKPACFDVGLRPVERLQGSVKSVQSFFRDSVGVASDRNDKRALNLMYLCIIRFCCK